MGFALWFFLMDGPWLVIDDFSAVLGAHEKKKLGGSLLDSRSCEDFAAMIHDCDLNDIFTSSAKYT